jgi:hypothetical protein
MLVAGSKLSIEVVEDAQNIDAIVGNSITKALALALDYASLYGSGSSNQPKGIRNQPGVTVTDLGTNGLTLTDCSKFSSAIATLMGYNFQGPFSAIYSARTSGEWTHCRTPCTSRYGNPIRWPPCGNSFPTKSRTISPRAARIPLRMPS